MDSTIIKHLNNTHTDKIRNSPEEKARALWVARKLGPYRCCDRCGKIAIRIKEVGTEDICQECNKKIPKREKVKGTLTAHQRRLLINRIRDANKTKFKIMNDIPARLRRLWGQCVHSVLDRYASARTDEDAFKALEAWAKLKVVLIMPLRAGRQKKKSRSSAHRQMITPWLAGDTEEC